MEKKYFNQDDMQIANTHMKRCSKSLANIKTQIKTTLKYHYISIRMVKLKNFKVTVPNSGEDRKLNKLMHRDGKAKYCSQLEKQSGNFLKN